MHRMTGDRIRLWLSSRSTDDRTGVGLFKFVRERLPARESTVCLVPPADLILVRFPAEIHDAAVAVVGEIYKTRAEVLDVYAEVFDFLDGFAERDHVGEVSGTKRA